MMPETSGLRIKGAPGSKNGRPEKRMVHNYENKENKIIEYA